MAGVGLVEALGWLAAGYHPFPLPAGQKEPPPEGATGANARPVTETQLEKWRWVGNMGVRLPDKLPCQQCGGGDAYVVGVDIDHYGDKQGAWQLRDWERHHQVSRGEVWVRVTSRGQLAGGGAHYQPGIYLYRVCATILSPDQLPSRHPAGEHVDIIRPAHRYFVAPGSTHPNGKPYQLFDGRTGVVGWIPPAKKLPLLAADYATKLRTAPPPIVVAGPKPLGGGWVADAAADFNRRHHPTTIISGLTRTRGGSGDYPEVYTWDGQSNRGAKAIAGPNRSGRWMIFSESLAARLGLAGHAGAGSSTWEPLDLAFAWTHRRPPTGSERVEWLTDRGFRPEKQEVVTPGPAAEVDETEFWGSVPEFQRVYETAMKRGVSPWVLLFVCLVRVSAAIPYRWKLPPSIGAPSPLNLFAVVVGEPGVGKSSAVAVAQELVEFPYDVLGHLDGASPSTGEGILKAFGAKLVAANPDDDEDTTKVTKLDHHYFFAVWDEAETLATQGMRVGSTLNSVLRTVWSGARSSTLAGTAERTRDLPAGLYSLGMLVNAHPHDAGTIFATTKTGDRGGAARWLAVSSSYEDLPRRTVDEALKGLEPVTPIRLGGWLVPELGGPSGFHYLDIDRVVLEEVVSNQNYRQENEGRFPYGEELDHGKHTDLQRLRLAGVLAYFRSQPPKVTAENWELTKVLLQQSTATRRWAATRATEHAATVRAGKAFEQSELAKLRRENVEVLKMSVMEVLEGQVWEVIAGGEGVTMDGLRGRLELTDRQVKRDTGLTLRAAVAEVLAKLRDEGRLTTTPSPAGAVYTPAETMLN